MKNGFEALPSLDSKAADDYEAANKKDIKGGKPSSQQYYPSPSEIPSEKEQKDLVDELSRLQLELVTAKKNRNAMRASLESLKRAEQAAGEALATIKANAPSLGEGEIRTEITKKAEQANTAGQLIEEAKALSEKLDGAKHDRNEKLRKKTEEEDGEENEYDFMQRDDPLYRGASYRMGSKRRKPLTLEEAYEEDRQRIGILRNSTNDIQSQNDNGSSGVTVQALKSMLLSRPSAPSSPRAPSPLRTPQIGTPGVNETTE